MRLSINNNKACIECRYEEKDLVKAIGNYKFNKKNSLWEFPLSSLIPIVEQLRIDYDKTVEAKYELLKKKQGEYEKKLVLATKIKAGKELSLPKGIDVSKLFSHQKTALSLACLFDSYALFLEMGLGKSLVAIKLIEIHKPAIVVAPLSTLESVWVNEIKKWSSLTCVNLWQNLDALDKDYDVYVVNFEHFKKIKDVSKIKTIVIDECFSGDTFIDTPKGMVLLENIQEGDEIYNCAGKCIVLKKYKRYIKKDDSLSLTTIQNNVIISSKNHLFFTQRGWVKAKELKEDDYVVYTEYGMRLVQERVNKETNSQLGASKEKGERKIWKEVLRDILFSEMENVATRDKSKNVYSRIKKKDKQKIKSVFQIRKSISEKTIRKNKDLEPDVGSKNKKKSFNNFKGNASQTINTRREWPSKSISTRTPLQNSEEKNNFNGMETESCYQPGEGSKVQRLSNKLQSRHCKFNTKVCNRSRWLFSLCNREEKTRFKKDLKIIGARVESSKIYKSTSSIFDRYRDKTGRVVLYDLKIERHPSFSVNGLIVHNSAKMKNFKSGITKHILSFKDKVEHKYILSGKPAPNNMMEYFAQVAFVNSELLSDNFYRFRSKYFYSSGFGGYLYIPFSGAKEAIMSQISKQAYFIKKEDAIDLPERTFETRLIEMDKLQRQKYDEMLKLNIMEYKNHVTLGANELAKLMKLRQLTSGFSIAEGGFQLEISKTKLNELKAVLDEIDNDRQVIIWCQFHWELRKLKEELGDDATMLYGEIKQKDKEQAIKDFQDGKYRFLIAHPKSGSHGINFQNCSYQIFYSLSYSLEEYSQGCDRIYRIGQVSKCTYIHLLAKNSIDEIIYKALEKKQSMSEACLEMLKK